MVPIKISEYLLLLTSSLALASAYAWTGDVYGFGSVNQTAFQQANQNPNATKGVFFQMGNNNYTLRVNVAEFEPTGANTNVQDPRVAVSFYELGWSGGSDLNETIRTAESIGNDTMPRLCLSLPLGLFSDSVTNGYKENDYADCSGALGSDCVNDLKNTGYSLNSPCIGQLPNSCQSKMPDGGVGSSSLIGLSSSRNSSSNESQTSPLDVAYYSSAIYQAGNDTLYQREAERLHVLIFSGEKTYPVCVRVKTANTSGAVASRRENLGMLMVFALGTALYLL